MELKVVCNCGQKFKFDVEPVNGRMPFTVNCPVCNVDATSLANLAIAEKLASNPPSAALEKAAPPNVIAPVSTGLRIAKAPVAPTPAVAESSASASDSAPPPIGASRPFAVAAAANPPQKTSFGMALLGGFIGALVGSII